MTITDHITIAAEQQALADAYLERARHLREVAARYGMATCPAAESAEREARLHAESALRHADWAVMGCTSLAGA